MCDSQLCVTHPASPLPRNCTHNSFLCDICFNSLRIVKPPNKLCISVNITTTSQVHFREYLLYILSILIFIHFLKELVERVG